VVWSSEFMLKVIYTRKRGGESSDQIKLLSLTSKY